MKVLNKKSFLCYNILCIHMSFSALMQTATLSADKPQTADVTEVLP